MSFGLVTNLERPGGNIMGIASMSSDLAAKRLEILTEAVPLVRRVGVIWNPDCCGQPATARADYLKASVRRRIRLIIDSPRRIVRW